GLLGCLVEMVDLLDQPAIALHLEHQVPDLPGRMRQPYPAQLGLDVGLKSGNPKFMTSNHCISIQHSCMSQRHRHRCPMRGSSRHHPPLPATTTPSSRRPGAEESTCLFASISPAQ